MLRLRVKWVTYRDDGSLAVAVVPEVMSDAVMSDADGTLGDVIATMSQDVVSFAEADAIARGVENGRTDSEWGNTEIEQLLLAAEITGTKLVPGRAAMPAVVDPTTGDVLRDALPATDAVVRSEGPRFPGVTAVVWGLDA